MLTRLANKKGIRIKVVDVDECGKKCDYISYVPFVEVDGQQVDASKLAKMLS